MAQVKRNFALHRLRYCQQIQSASVVSTSIEQPPVWKEKHNPLLGGQGLMLLSSVKKVNCSSEQNWCHNLCPIHLYVYAIRYV